MTYSVDRHLWPIEITSSNNTIVWDENGTTQSATFATGTYYAFLGDGGEPYSGLWLELIQTMNGTSPDTYSVSASTPSGSSLTNSGATVTNDSGNSWTWLFSDGSFTLDKQLLGYHPDSTDPALATSQASPYSIWGKWQSYIWWDVRGASDKRRDWLYDVERSTDRLSRAYSLEYGDGEVTRKFEYQYIPAAHVYPRRAEDSAHADNAGLPAPSSGKGDINNALYDLHRKAQRGGEIIVLHDRGDASDVISSFDQWEAYKASGRRLSKWIGEDPEEDLAEQYNASWETQIVNEPTTDGRKDYVTTP